MSTAQPYPRRKWTLTVLCLSLLVISLDNTILNTALPRLARDLHATDSQLQWIVDSYMLVFAARRLQADEVALLFAVRDGTHQFPAGGLSSCRCVAWTPPRRRR
ncbi:MAG TPA: hypothetical protein VMU39_16985 [Solirubrobacteraceae bacterium]|nr:hypothetical protein [Solirubrobacteraceae bacterium]